MKLSLLTQLAVAACATAQVMDRTAGLSGRVSAAKLHHRVRQDNGTAGGWPYAPFSTRGRDIVNSRGDVMTFAGVNWPMSGETMIPEGLEFASAAEILDRISSMGWNMIRFGYAIEMIDQIYDRAAGGGGNATTPSASDDVPLEVALVNALGYANGTKVTRQILQRNPGWTPSTTRLEILSSVVELAAERGVYALPDVHVSRAQWCCSHTDGNAWFGDVHFDTARWRRGLAHMARWAGKHPSVVGLSLRNELRESWNVTGLYYNWQTLVGNMSAGADAIHAANPDLLITWSGMQYSQDLSALTTAGSNLLTSPCYRCTAIRDAARRPAERFDLGSRAWADKLVWELHMYRMSEDLDTGTCEAIEANLYRAGFNALGIEPPPGCNASSGAAPACSPAGRLTPVIFSEFGHAQDSTLPGDVLQRCIRGFTTRHSVSWMAWSIAGSYRIRSGVQGFADTWGLTNYDWSGWRSPELVEGWWKPWVAEMNVSKRG